MPNVTRHADYFAVDVACADEDLADGILPRPDSAGQSFIDYDDGFTGGAVVRGKVATFEQRNAHGFEIAIARDANEGPGRRMILRIGAAFGHRRPGSVPAQRKHVGQASGFNARHGSDAAKNFIEVDNALRAVRISCAGIDAEGRGIFGLESNFDVEQANKASNQQSRGCQEQARESDL